MCAADLGRGLEVNQGSLYPALQRLEKEGLIASEWRTTETGAPATASSRLPGGVALGAEVESWRRFAAAMEVILRTPDLFRTLHSQRDRL